MSRSGPLPSWRSANLLADSWVLTWLASVAGGLVVFEIFRKGGTHYAELAISAIVLVAFVLVSSARPQIALIGIVVWVPLQIAALSYLYRLGAPTSVVRHLGYLKEFWAISLVVAMFRPGARRVARRFDLLDKLAIGYVGVASAYLLLPLAASGSLGGEPWSVRLNAWRLDALFVVVFLCARRLVLDGAATRRLRNAVFVVAIVMAGFAIWESVNSTAFNNFMITTIRLPEYSANVLNAPLSDPTSVISQTALGGATFTRDGSLFNDPLTLGFFMLIPLGLGLERVGARRTTWLSILGTAAAVTGVLLSVTRSAIVGAALASLLAVGLAVRSRSPGRLRLVFVLVAFAVLLAPSAGHASFTQRFGGIFLGSQDPDSQEHLVASKGALTSLIDHPMGLGLGANTGTGTRFNTSNQITSENSYLETGNELGLAAAILFVAALLTLLWGAQATRSAG